MLFNVIKSARAFLGDVPVGVMFSTGKDSIVSLDIVSKYFSRFSIIYTYIVKDLSYKDSFLDYYGEKYKCEVHKLPCYELSEAYRSGGYTGYAQKVPRMTFRKDEEASRERTGTEWIAYGHRANESFARRGMMASHGGIDQKGKRLYPLAFWKRKQVEEYIEDANLPLPPEYADGFRDICSFTSKETLEWLIDRFPSDFERVVKQFPQTEALLYR